MAFNKESISSERRSLSRKGSRAFVIILMFAALALAFIAAFAIKTTLLDPELQEAIQEVREMDDKSRQAPSPDTARADLNLHPDSTHFQ